MRFGFHISIAGGFSKVAERANIRGCETIQFFSRNPRGWKYGPLDKKEGEAFRASIQSSGLFPVFLHLPYLPNIASLSSTFYSRSVDSIATDLERAAQLGAQYLIIHIGHRLDSSEDEAINAVSQGINQALKRVRRTLSSFCWKIPRDRDLRLDRPSSRLERLLTESMKTKGWGSASIRPILLRQDTISPIKTVSSEPLRTWITPSA